MPQHTAFRSALPLRNNSFPCLCFAPLLRAVPSPISALPDISMPYLRGSKLCHRLTFLAPPRRGCTLLCCFMPLPRSFAHNNAIALLIRSQPCPCATEFSYASASQRYVLPLLCLALRFTCASPLFYAMPPLFLASPCIALPLQFNSAQCHSKTPLC